MFILIASWTHHLFEIGGAIALIFLAWPGGLTSALLGGFCGWLIGSFAEYGLHRFVLHGPRIFSASHGRHHVRPEELQIDAMSWLAPFMLQGAAGLLAFALTDNEPMALALTAGAMLQYSCFRIVHRLLHASPPMAVLSTLSAFHDVHHLCNGKNFGVTTRFWDIAFGTDLSDAAVAAVPPVIDAQLSISINDPRPESDAPRSKLERYVASWLRDMRDLAFIRIGSWASLLLVGGAALIYIAPSWLSVLLALPYWWLLYARYGGPVMLMVHALFHRKAFVGPGRWIDRWLRHGLPMLYGLQPFAYFPQHLVMHHTENNLWGDLSSTFGYRRDHWPHFIRYWLRFMGGDNFRLARYLHSHGQRAILWRFALGSLSWLGAVAALMVVSPTPTLIVFVVPYVLTRFFLMAGNWAQHAFVNPDESDPRLGHSIILINAQQNERCFNDGYHAVHHRRPGLHWADMSTTFQRDWRHYAEQGVLVFDGVPNNQVIWWRLMRRDFAYLADHLAHVPWLPAQREDRIRLLQQRAVATPPASTQPGLVALMNQVLDGAHTPLLRE